jgi:beta-lysine 5,6-aminomutase beta subunit
MAAAFREAYPAGRRPLLVVGGPRFDESAAQELGVDRIFVKGATPGEVASYLTHALLPPAGPAITRTGPRPSARAAGGTR